MLAGVPMSDDFSTTQDRPRERSSFEAETISFRIASPRRACGDMWVIGWRA
jgi:hypothetical protein